MTMLLLMLVLGGITFVVSVLLPFAVRPLLVRLGIMDVPNDRSSHDRPVLRGLGLAVLMAIAVGDGFALALWFTDPVGMASALTLLVVTLGSIAAGVLGLCEDLRGLSVAIRSAGLLAVAASVVGALMWIVLHPPGAASFSWVPGLAIGGLPAWVLVLLGVYGVLFISSYINVANFMDGLNGISGFHGLIAGATFVVVGSGTGYPWLMVAGLVLAAAFLGFLPWNLSRRGGFLGDVGSYLLGGAVAITSFAAFTAGVPMLATIGPMVIYFGDVGVTLVKRVRAGHKWDEPHKEHVYQRIQQLGYSHVAASVMAAGATLLTSALGVASIGASLGASFVLLAGGFMVLAFYMLLPRLLPARRGAA